MNDDHTPQPGYIDVTPEVVCDIIAKRVNEIYVNIFSEFLLGYLQNNKDTPVEQIKEEILNASDKLCETIVNTCLPNMPALKDLNFSVNIPNKDIIARKDTIDLTDLRFIITGWDKCQWTPQDLMEAFTRVMEYQESNMYLAKYIVKDDKTKRKITKWQVIAKPNQVKLN